jgi:hypothetical protein
VIETSAARVRHVLEIKDQFGEELEVLEMKLAMDEDYLVAYVDVKCAFDENLLAVLQVSKTLTNFNKWPLVIFFCLINSYFDFFSSKRGPKNDLFLHCRTKSK